MAINNRYEFVYYLACKNCNPNGDPDMDNAPRMDPLTQKGLISDAAIKRRVRKYVETAHGGEPGMNIIVQQGTNINRFIAEAKRNAGVDENSKTKASIYAARQKACEMFYDVRTFGAVMSTGPNAGQVRGPVQIAFAESLDRIFPLSLAITRMASTENITNGTYEDYLALEEKDAENGKERKTMGRKQMIGFGLYEVRGFISANLAAETGFDDEDLNILCEAIMNMYEHDRSSSKGEMAVVSPLILFKHVGTDTNMAQRQRQARLGCAHAHKLFELVTVEKKDGIEYPQNYRDYNASIKLSAVPAGVEVGFHNGTEAVWGKLPADETWFVAR